MGGTHWEDELFPQVLQLELINSELIYRSRIASDREKKMIDIAVSTIATLARAHCELDEQVE